MSKPLLIVESPAKAKTITKYLNDAFVVKASIGHIRDLPKSNKDAVDIKKGFVPKYVISPDKKKVIAELREYAKKADDIYLATDPDREGEAIAWHIAEVLDINDDPSHVKRVTFNEITKEAVQEAIKHPRAIDINLLRAQEARRVLDRLVGYDLSGLVWKKVRYGLSAGRVQSPALRIIMEREREIRAFVPQTYFVITAQLTSGKQQFEVECSEEFNDKKIVDKIVADGKSNGWQVADIITTQQDRKARPPFRTSTLQAAASTYLGFSPSRTMRIAQQLYEAGHITYMRTDSMNLAKSAQDAILAHIYEHYGKEFVSPVSYSAQNNKLAQEAHEAVRPTHIEKTSISGTDEQEQLYDLIWKRTVASQMKPARVEMTRLEVKIVKSDAPVFVTNGIRTLFAGWMKVDTYVNREEKTIPAINKGDTCELVSIDPQQKETQPPNRYSEAGLIKELEKRGIGRPSTYASIMNTLVERGYVDKQGKTLIPTLIGDVVSTFIEQNFAKYISDTFTAEMENELDEIADGKRDYAKTLKDFYTPFTKEVESKQDVPKLTTLGKVDDSIVCPKCGSSMVLKLSKTGSFMSCSRFPECDGARNDKGEELKDPDSIGVDEVSGLPVFVLVGPFGPYVQLGQKTKTHKSPKRASIPKEIDPSTVTLEMALKYLSLPRVLGKHPEHGQEVIANNGRFGPYVGSNGEFRSLKVKEGDDVYTVTLERALELLATPKPKRGGFKRKAKEG
ncbi:type I DNA topoisomerase [Candidatus Falkowbacteria bacterium]|nr:type I DNA topoisomerase [Candidatus Falkowbacteria bacterium]